MNNFIEEMRGDVVIQKVNLKRATFRETEEFKRILIENFNRGEVKIVVDLSECEFMDSTFLSTIVTNLKKASESGGNLVLVNVHSETQSLIELTGTSKIFQVYNKIDEAVESFSVSKES